MHSAAPQTFVPTKTRFVEMVFTEQAQSLGTLSEVMR